jgi:hypothetical protein
MTKDGIVIGNGAVVIDGRITNNSCYNNDGFGIKIGSENNLNVTTINNQCYGNLLGSGELS